MESKKLKALTRDKKVNAVRNEGYVPAIVYGHDVTSTSIQIPENVFTKLYLEIGESTIIDLDVDGKVHNVLIKDVQADPVTGDYLHVDFYAIKMDEEITAEVELEYVGESKAVKDEDGILVKNIDTLNVTCLPANLPKNISVDISVLGTFDDVISVKDLVLSPGVTVDRDKDDTVATVTPPRSEEELAELDEAVEEDVEGVEGVAKEGEDEEGEATEKEAAASPEKKDEKDEKAEGEQDKGKTEEKK
ncbi:50S ribosomal protein L25 [Patescibacteria group bacterium]|nr:50S ribosomal protein L25 [Patescibacteria group bacterium]